MIGNAYWSNAITIQHRDGKWGGELAYLDDGFANDDTDARLVSTEGVLRTRYLLPDGFDLDALTVVIDTLLADAAKLGIEMRGSGNAMPTPLLFVDEGDQSEEPGNWQELKAAQMARLGWVEP
jgi:hypothetical protein